MSSISAGTTSTTTLIHSGDTTGSLVFKTNDTGSGGTTAVTIDTSQNVGIGTSSPVSKLNINGGAVTLAETTLGLYNIDFQSRTASTNARIQYDQLTNTTGQLLFYTNGGSLTERMRIDSSGNLYVGQTSGDYVNSNSLKLASATNTGYLLVNHINGSSSGNVFVGFGYNGGAIGNITQNGTTAVAYNTSSDYRLKENIAPLTGALNKVAQLKPVTYTWKASPEETGEGFIAHELAEVCPQAVHGTKDEVDAEGNPKYQGIDTSFLVATLTAALQETKALIDQQAETINALTARVVALEGQ